jgi:hypothetical protein
MIEWCTYCKEDIEDEAAYVYKNGKYYHLQCYLLMIGVDLNEIEEDTFDE